MSSYKRPREELRLREADPLLVENLSQELSISETLARVLVARGLHDFEKSKAFFNPSLEGFHDPSLFRFMEKAVDRILLAIERDEPITIHGDYDVDGVTSTTVLMRVFRKLKIRCDYYLPDRLTQGYGLTTVGIDNIAQRGSKLIITVDCAITAVEAVAHAKTLGIDTIITDHHEPQEELPDAVAILDHKVAGETYPEQNLAGVGMALKLAQAVCRRLNAPEDFWADELDIVSLGTAADIVPLVGENRLIAHFGYKKMRETKNLGLATLMKLQKVAGKDITTADVVFKLAPCINAAGRLGDPTRGVKLFLSEDEGESLLFARELVKVNTERKAYDEKVQREAIEFAETEVDMDDEYVVVAGRSDWHAGVIGIAASKLVERFCRPAFLFSIGEDGKAHGSGRSIEGCDLVEALTECSDLLRSYGGHKVAAGASLMAENFPEFRRRFNLAVKKQLTKEQLVPVVKCDAEIRIAQLTPKFFNIIKRMEPFGPRNMRPVLISHNITNRVAPKTVGKGGLHLKMSVISEGQVIDAIGFNLGDRAKELALAEHFTLAFTLTENEYMGRCNLQMNIKGILIP